MALPVQLNTQAQYEAFKSIVQIGLKSGLKFKFNSNPPDVRLEAIIFIIQESFNQYGSGADIDQLIKDLQEKSVDENAALEVSWNLNHRFSHMYTTKLEQDMYKFPAKIKIFQSLFRLHDTILSNQDNTKPVNFGGLLQNYIPACVRDFSLKLDKELNNVQK